MKCRDCDCCRLGYFKSSPSKYVCTGVKNPFVINDINVECTEYPEKRNKKTNNFVGRCRCQANNNDFIAINHTTEYSGIELAINRQGMLRARYYDINGGDVFESQDIVNIKHCPFCGREFNN